MVYGRLSTGFLEDIGYLITRLQAFSLGDERIWNERRVERATDTLFYMPETFMLLKSPPLINSEEKVILKSWCGFNFTTFSGPRNCSFRANQVFMAVSRLDSGPRSPEYAYTQRVFVRSGGEAFGDEVCNLRKFKETAYFVTCLKPTNALCEPSQRSHL